MKLVEILARDFNEWPADKDYGDVAMITQEYDGTLNGYVVGDKPETSENAGRVWTSGAFYLQNEEDDIRTDVADDQSSAIVTRAQWQEAREALSKPVKPGSPMPPVNSAPDGATHWDPGYKCEPAWACKMGGVWNWHPVGGAPIDSGWRVYPFQGGVLESRLVAIERPWSGEGLPPVGRCELRLIAAGSDWHEADIKFASRNVVVRDWVDEPSVNGLCTGYVHTVQFRPLRTPEQIAAEERESFIRDLIQVTCIRHGEAGLIYDAGYRKVKDGNQEA